MTPIKIRISNKTKEKLNKRLERINLEIVSVDGRLNVYLKDIINRVEFDSEALTLIRQEMRSAKKITDFTYLSYFQQK